jgi:HSP20 family protein
MNKEISVKRHHAVPAMSGAWQSFRQEIDRLFDRFSDGFESVSLQPFTNLQQLWSPGVTGFANLAVDVADSDEAYTITAELPGVKEKDIEISVSDDLLVIKGEKRLEKEEKSRNHFLSERSYGAFQRMFNLPHGTDSRKVEASFQAGVLKISIPKTGQKQQARKIEVKAA